jgi:alkanesulfonate monooxygenase SsuD/methylene tetrahydromethanopterin reductase-like flavin-dependent oxidoreductase (luciferase family)
MPIGWNGGGHHTSLDASTLPAYRTTLTRGELDGPEGLLAVGSEDVVRERLLAFEAAGATDLRVNTLCPTPEETERTHALLRALCAERNGA